MNLRFSSNARTGWILSLTVTLWLIFMTLSTDFPADNRGLFFALEGGFLLVNLGIGYLLWYLLFRPLPQSYVNQRESLVSAEARYWLGFLLILGILGVGIGSVWDEVWHAKFGIPLGADLLWRPHILLYFGLGITSLAAMGSLYLIFTRAKGTWQQRFQTDPILGFTVIAGGYMLFALMLDPLWHYFYGADLTAWSLPHALLLVMDLIMGITGMILIATTTRVQQWRVVAYSWRNLLLGVAIIGMLLTFAVVLLIDVYLPANVMTPDLNIRTRPVWVMAASITFMSAFIGALTIYASRQIGFLTILILSVLVLRWQLDNFLTSPIDGASSIWLMITICVCMDIFFLLIWRLQGMIANWKACAVLVALVANTINAVILVIVLPYFDMMSGTMPFSFSLLTLNIVAAFMGVWIGKQIGDFIAHSHNWGILDMVHTSWRFWLLNTAMIIGVTVFLLVFIWTATPPQLT